MYFLGLIANQRELFQVGRDLNAQTGNLSPLVAAGLFYLALTIPLTHLVNFIDTRLRRGRRPRRGGSAGAVDLAGDELMCAAFEPVSLSARDIHLSFGNSAVLRGGRPRRRGRDHGRRDRTVGGVGQVDAAAHTEPALRADRGDILLDGRSVLTDNPPDRLRQRIGMVFQ